MKQFLFIVTMLFVADSVYGQENVQTDLTKVIGSVMADDSTIAQYSRSPVFLIAMPIYVVSTPNVQAIVKAFYEKHPKIHLYIVESLKNIPESYKAVDIYGTKIGIPKVLLRGNYDN